MNHLTLDLAPFQHEDLARRHELIISGEMTILRLWTFLVIKKKHEVESPLDDQEKEREIRDLLAGTSGRSPISSSLESWLSEHFP